MNVILVSIVFFYFLFGLVTATLGFWYACDKLKGQRKLILVSLFLFCMVAWVYISFYSSTIKEKRFKKWNNQKPLMICL